MILYHFRLHARRLHRMVSAMGPHPLINYFICAALFLGMSFTLFSHSTRIMIAYMFIALQVVSIWSDPAYNDFQKTTYCRSDYYSIRLIENILTSLPFALFLCFSAYYYSAIGLLVVSALMALFSFKIKWQVVLPTPFFKHPFEFVAGFRISFFLVLLGYYLTFISIYHANFGIGLFVLFATGILCALYHSYVEDAQYVWIFSCHARKFLQYKLITGWAYTTLLSSPVLLALSWANPDKLSHLLLTHCVSLAFVSAGVLSKYASFPHDISLRDGLLLMFSIMFPPLLLFSLPYYYLSAMRQLKEILQ